MGKKQKNRNKAKRLDMIKKAKPVVINVITGNESPVTINTIYNSAPQTTPPQQSNVVTKSIWRWLLPILTLLGGLSKFFSTS